MKQQLQHEPWVERIPPLELAAPRVLKIGAGSEEGNKVIRALASTPRRRILELLSDRVCNVSEIAESLHMPASTATLHVSTLEESGLVKTEMQPGQRGLQKVCSRAYDVILVQLPQDSYLHNEQIMEIAMPIGAYVDCEVEAPCGLAGDGGIIGNVDTPSTFYEPSRIDAQLLWFRHGYVEYRFPNRLLEPVALESLSLTMELCSEAPLHHNRWNSDITVWINEVEVATWTSPADFGGERGLLTPTWWGSHFSQFGLLKQWEVTREASRVDGVEMSATCLADLKIMERPYIAVRIGNRSDALHRGGLNLFGRNFGNYPQDLILRLHYYPESTGRNA